MRPRGRRFALGAGLATAVAALVLLPAAQAGAHPLGNFTVNRYDGLVAAPGELRVDHVEDLAEIPATQAGPGIERAGGLTGWARQRCVEAARGSGVTVAGRAARLGVAASTAHRLPGQAGLDTLRLECRLTAPLPETGTVRVVFRGAGGPASGPGWREITARGDRTTLTGSDVPGTSVSHELTDYPKELLSSPRTPRAPPSRSGRAARRWTGNGRATPRPPRCCRAAPTAGPVRWTAWWPGTTSRSVSPRSPCCSRSAWARCTRSRPATARP